MNFKDYLEELMGQTKPVAMSKLVKLSNLQPSDIKLFTDGWGRTNVERRRQIVTMLDDLAETNLELDFDHIFEICLHDPDSVVRVKALECLAESEDYRIIEAVISLFNKDPDIEVRNATAIVLGNFALLAELDKLPAHYTDKVAQALLAVIDSTTADVDTKRRAIEAISPLSLPKVKDIIAMAYESNDIKTRCSALYAMGRNCDTYWLPTLLSELNSNNAELRYEAAQACGELGDDSAVASLIKLIDDIDNKVRIAAINALGEIGGEEAKNALLECRERPDPDIQEAVEEVLAVLDFYQEPFSLSM